MLIYQTSNLRCFSNMFYSVLGQMLEHFVPFCPVQLHCIFSLTNYFLTEQINDDDEDDDVDETCFNCFNCSLLGVLAFHSTKG